MSHFLTYAVSPSKVYVSSDNGSKSTASLTLTVTNDTGADVTFCLRDKITFTVPTAGNGALTNDAGSSIPTSADPNIWSFQTQTTGSNQFTGFAVMQLRF